MKILETLFFGSRENVTLDAFFFALRKFNLREPQGSD